MFPHRRGYAVKADDYKRSNAVGVSLPASKLDHLTSSVQKIRLDDSPTSDYHSRSSDQSEPTQLQKDLDIMFEKQAREKLTDVPHYSIPSQFREGLKLYDHQKEGIRWLVHQERSGGADGFFTATEDRCGRKAWRCNISDELQPFPPKQAKGAILADGK